MTRNVDEPHTGAVGKDEVGESEIDGDPAGLLFLETIGIGPGEGQDQPALAVVDVPRGADDDLAGGARRVYWRTRLTFFISSS